MNQTHIRSYRIVENGDVEVVDGRDGEYVDLSSHYRSEPRDRGGLRLETSLDVFLLADGRLTWSASPHGRDTESAAALSLLLRLFLDDVLGRVGAPRSF